LNNLNAYFCWKNLFPFQDAGLFRMCPIRDEYLSDVAVITCAAKLPTSLITVFCLLILRWAPEIDNLWLLSDP
jgi:hypothetical protein